MSRYIVLDLDNTVLYTEDQSSTAGNLKFRDGSTYQCTPRPYFDEFMDYLHDAKIVAFVWSAGSPEYVHCAVDTMFPYMPQLVWTSEKCERKRDVSDKTYPYIKPLEKLFRYMGILFPEWWTEDDLYDRNSVFPNMYNTLMLDDKKEIAVDNAKNHYHIPEFNGEPDDRELVKVMMVLDDWTL